MKQNNKQTSPQTFICSECGSAYKDKEWAEKCEAWCREHKSCNLEVISHAIENNFSKQQ